MKTFKLLKCTTIAKIIAVILFTAPPALAANTTNTFTTVTPGLATVNGFDDFSGEDTPLAVPEALQTIYLGFGATDLLTSLNLASTGTATGLHELNPVLGTRPSILEYSLALPAVFGVTTGIASALNPRDRTVVLLLAGLGEVYSVITNLTEGLGPLLYALPTVFFGIGVGVVVGIVAYYAAKTVLEHFHYYDYKPKHFVSRPWPLKGEART